MSEQLIDQLLPIIEHAEGSEAASKMMGVPVDEVRSEPGAVGRYQVMPATARLLGLDPARLTEPDYNRQAARAALADLIRQHGPNDIDAIIAGYNASPRAVDRWKRSGRNPASLPTETQGYLKKAQAFRNSRPQNNMVVDEALRGPAGKVLAQEMIDNGFSSSEALEWKVREERTMKDAGFSPNEIAAYFGDEKPSTEAIDALAHQDVQAFAEGYKYTSNSLFGDFMGGYQNSATSYALNGMPKVKPREATFGQAMAAGAGQLIGDLPFAIVGTVGGAVAGTAATANPIGGLIGGGAGGMAAPEAFRQIIIDQYRNPNGSKTYAEMWNRYSEITWNVAKATAMGAVFGPAGKTVVAPALKYSGSRVVSNISEMIVGNAASTAVGAAMDGQMPDANHFAASSMLLLGVHGISKVVGAQMRPVPTEGANVVAEHMRGTYAKTGVPPWDQVKAAEADRGFRFDMLTEDVNMNPITERFEQIRTPEPNARNMKEKGATIEQQIVEAAEAGDAEKVSKLKEADAALSQVKPEEEAMLLSTYRDIPPRLAREYGFDLEKMATDPEYYNKAGITILNDLMKHFKGDKEAAFVAFNSSVGQAEAWIARGRKDKALDVETQRALVRATYAGAFNEPPKGGGGGKKPPGGGQGAAAGGEKPKKITDETIKKSDDLILEDALGLVAGEENKSLVGRTGDVFRSAYDQTVSALGPFKRLDKILKADGTLKADQVGIEDMFRSTFASPERAGLALTRGALGLKTEIVNGEAVNRFAKVSDEHLKMAFDTAVKNGGTREGLIGYWLMARQIEKAEQGIDTGGRVKLEEAQRFVKNQKKVYGEAIEIARRVNDFKLDYMRDSGLYSAETIKNMKNMNKKWIPHKRIYGGSDVFSSKGFSRFLPGKRLQKMEGSDLEIAEPVMAMVESFHTGFASADRNRAIGALIGSQEAREFMGLKLATPDRPKLTGGNIYEGGMIVKEKFVGGKKVEYETVNPDPNDVLLEQKAVYGNMQPNEFPYWRDGVLEIWTVRDPELAKSIRGQTHVETWVGLRTAKWFAGVQRSGITALPDYIMKMVIRDQFTTPIVTKHGGLPFQNMVIGTMGMIGRQDKFFDFVANGGMGASLASMDANYIGRSIDKLFLDTGVTGKVINTVANPVEAMRMTMERADAVSRMGMFERQKAKGIDPLKAAMRSRQWYIDFVERGTSELVQQWSSVTPFLRPRILGYDQIARAFKEDPYGVTARGFGMIGTISAALFAYNWLQDKGKDPDDPSRYDQIPPWQRFTNFVLPEVNGVRVRIPRSQGEIGLVFGGLIDATLGAAAAKDSREFEDWAVEFLNAMNPTNSLTPAIALPFAEQWANKSAFTGRPLIPATLEGASGYMQYTENTTDLSRFVSKRLLAPVGLDVSPIILENYLAGWTGTVGRDVMQTLNATRPSNKPWNVADVPFVNSFTVRNPTMQATAIQHFFEDFDQVEEKVKNKNLALKRMNETEIAETTAENAAFLNLRQIAETIGDQYGIIQAINDAPIKDIPIAEKRQIIDDTYSTMITLSRAGSEIAREMLSNTPAAEEAPSPLAPRPAKPLELLVTPE
jgi:hypothetical protein